MNRVKILAQIGEEIEAYVVNLGAWQGQGLAVLVFGLLSLRQAQLSKIGEGAAGEALGE